MKVLLSIIVFCCSCLSLYSQFYEPLYTFHVRGSLGPTYSFGTAPSLQSMVLCSQYQPTVQNGYEVVAGLERGFGEQVGNVVKRSHLSLGASIGFSTKHFTFEASNSFPFWDSIAQNVSTLSIQSDYWLVLQSVDITAEVLYRLPQIFPKSQTKLVGGVSAIVPLTLTFEQKETILTPRNATFNDENGNPRRSVVLANGNTEFSSVFYRANVGVVNSVFISRHLELLQRIEFQIYSNPISSTKTWIPTTLQASLGISYTLPNQHNPDTPLSPGSQKK
jgi:hypothetical protein